MGSLLTCVLLYPVDVATDATVSVASVVKVLLKKLAPATLRAKVLDDKESKNVFVNIGQYIICFFTNRNQHRTSMQFLIFWVLSHVCFV